MGGVPVAMFALNATNFVVVYGCNALTFVTSYVMKLIRYIQLVISNGLLLNTSNALLLVTTQ